VALLIVLLGAGCSGEQPEIYQQQWRLDVVADPSGTRQAERLTLFVLAEDADGYEDLARLTLHHPDQELYWEMDSDTWRRFRFSGENWIGSDALRAPEGERFPRGRYRVIVEDRAGEKSETELFLSPEIRGLSSGPLGEARLPAPPGGAAGSAADGGGAAGERAAGEAGIYFPFEQGALVLLDERQRELRAVAMEEAIGAGGVPEAAALDRWRSEGARYVALVSYSPELGYGVERGPYPLERLRHASSTLPAAEDRTQE
jgi:hypothetical protein